MDKGVLETLVAARKLIELPEHWTQGAYFRNSQGVRIYGFNPDTAQCCMVGALSVAEGTIPVTTEGGEAFSLLKQICFPMGVINYNDTHTHAEVLAAFDEAIEKLKKGSHE